MHFLFVFMLVHLLHSINNCVCFTDSNNTVGEGEQGPQREVHNESKIVELVLAGEAARPHQHEKNVETVY